ncbi:MAG TPA: hypothetical protein VGI00_24905 [Streptosporangiaceae bacterium]
MLVDQVFDDPDEVLELVVRHAPYWNQARYQPANRRVAAATTPAGHPYAMDGGAPPLFRGNWADAKQIVDDAGPLLDAPALHNAAQVLFGGRLSVPSFLYVNVTAPMPRTDTGHVDVPSFRDLDRRSLPGWFLLAMERSGLFDRWAVRTATAVVWFYQGTGGELSYWPDGPDGLAQTAASTSNHAIVGDNDRMRHRVEAVGDPARWRAVPREALLHHAGQDCWEVRDGDQVIEVYRFTELRISLSWKAEVYLDEAEHERRVAHQDDLTPAGAISIMAAELRRQGRWPGADDPDVADPQWAEAVMSAYPRAG